MGAGEDQRAEGGRRRSNREITQGLLEADLAIMSQQCYLSAGTRLQKVGEEADGWRRTGDGPGILGRLGGAGDLNMHEATDGATPRVAGCLGIWLRAGEMGRIVSYVIFVCVAAPTTAAAQEKTSPFQRAKVGLAQGSVQSSSSQCSLEMFRSSAQLRGLHWSDCWPDRRPSGCSLVRLPLLLYFWTAGRSLGVARGHGSFAQKQGFLTPCHLF